MNTFSRKITVSSKWLTLMMVILIPFVSGCAFWGASQSEKLTDLPLAPLSEMPDYVQQAAPEVQEAYRFAVANPDLLRQIPCYCGCNAMGHMNNFDCYVASAGEVIEFDNHAAY